MLFGRIRHNPTVGEGRQKTCRQIHPVGQFQKIVEESRLLLIEVHVHVDDTSGWLVYGPRIEGSERRRFH